MRGLGLALLMIVAIACQPVDTGASVRSSPSPVLVATLTPATPAPSSPGGTAAPTKAPQTLTITEFKVGAGQGPHDVAPAVDGGVWYTAQRTGELGYLDPKTGTYRMINLGVGSAPHGVIVGPDGNPWVTDGGLNAIVRFDPTINTVRRYPLPANRPNANLNTATFDREGTLWFTGQNGVFGWLAPATGDFGTFAAPKGPGPYGIATCPDGKVYFASLAGNYIARVSRDNGADVALTPPTSSQGARRVWCDSQSRVWVSEWSAGQVARYDGNSWKEWKLPGANPMAYAVYVDDQDIVWLTDFGANAIVRFDPKSETFTVLPHSAPNAAVRQLLGRPGEVWGAMSGQDKLLVVRTR
jgi:virginiamycin B lyase